MDDREDPLPSFYHQLAIEPGQEVEAFYSRLVWAVDLTHDAWRDEHDERIAKLDALYSRHGLPSEPANFAAAIDLEERATAPAEPASETRTFENGGGLKLHAFSTDALDLVEPVALEVETNFYEFGSEEALVAHHQWSLQPHVKRLWALALAECARSGTVKLPSHWTPSTLYTTVNDGRVAATFRDGFGIFKIHLSPQLQCMQQYALLLFSDEPPPWILDRYGPQRGGNSAREQTALIAWDETVGLHARGNYPAAINALMVIDQLLHRATDPKVIHG